MVAGLTATDVLLLKSALLTGQAAKSAYEAWRPTFDLETADYGRQRLLPLVHRNLVGLGIADPLMRRLRGIRHYYWARNQLRLQATAPVLKALKAAAIPTMALKGAALLATCLDDSSLRPMDDIDILIPPDRVAAAVDILVAHGFHPIGVPHWAIATTVIQRMPGFTFDNGSGEHIDLHWRMLNRDQRIAADQTFWTNARPARLAGVDLVAPSFDHQIFHVIVHASEWNPVSPIRWATDVLTILRAAGDTVKWEELANEAIARDLAPPVRDALNLLARELKVDVPDTALRTLQRGSRRLLDLEFSSRKIPPQEQSKRRRRFVAMCDLRRSRGELLRRSFVRSLWPFVTDQIKARGLARQLPLLLFWMLGRPHRLRRILHIDRWARSINPESLPSLGENIDFEEDNAGNRAFIDGWSIPELTGRWTEGSEARLAWRLPSGFKSSILCTIDAKMFAAQNVPAAIVEVWVNDRLLQVWGGPGDNTATCRDFIIPATDLADRQSLVMTFAVRGANSPYRAGVSHDVRELGMHLRRVRIVPCSIAPSSSA